MSSDITFPIDIELPLRDSLRDTYEETRSRTEVDDGITIVRKWNTVTPRVYELVWDMSQEEFDVFEDWFHNVIKGSARRFDIPIQDDSGHLGWITAQGIGEYYAEHTDGFNWEVRWRVKTITPIFYGRVPTPFYGKSAVQVVVHGNLDVLKSFFGSTFVGIVSAEVVTESVAYYGKASVGVRTATGRALPGPFYGACIVGVTGVGVLWVPTFTCPDHSTAELKFSASSYTPPAADYAELRLLDCPYTPPTIT